ncbi:MAG: hemerythrin domain-containing protein [Dehalococcoidia bacterium]|nr:hemerythrin domain-containing protein [Dehalococcoidia bacterium]
MATFGNLETDVEPLAGLMREHIEVHGLVTAAREAVDLAIERPGQTELALAAMENLRDLVAYLEVDLVIHIAKEEDVLFPALRGFAAEIDKVVAEMVEQHDEVACGRRSSSVRLPMWTGRMTKSKSKPPGFRRR